MTQDDLKDYLELPGHDCYVYKTIVKDDGTYYFMRKHGATHLAVLFPPKRGVYKEENVCHICNILKVAPPNWAKSAQQTLDDAKKEIQKKQGKSEDPEGAE